MSPGAPTSVVAMSRRAKYVCRPLGTSHQLPRAGDRARRVPHRRRPRLNFSHGARADHATAYRRVRQASDATGHAVAVLAD